MNTNSGNPVRIITLMVPPGSQLPDLTDFTPAQTLCALIIGANSVREAITSVAALTQKEISERIKEENREQIRKLEMDLIVERRCNDRTKEDGDRTAAKAQEVIVSLKAQLARAEQEFLCKHRSITEEALKAEKEKMQVLINEKERQNQLTRDTFEKATALISGLTTGKSMSQIGKEGELTFAELAATFNDFQGFELIDKHSESKKGDYHLRFEEFDVLVDAKNYKNNVPSKEREKIKKDLIANSHIHFAWLISLNTDIDTCKKSPVTYELVDGRYVVYVNNLLQYNNPQQFLRILWSNCKELKRLIMDEASDKEEDNGVGEELREYKKRCGQQVDKIRGYIKSIREINATINNLKKLLDNMQMSMSDTLSEDTQAIVGGFNTIVSVNSSDDACVNEVMVNANDLLDTWWKANMERVKEEGLMIKSTDIWYKFRADNEQYLEDIDAQKFKKMLMEYLDDGSYVRLKGKTSAIEVKNYRFKEAAVVKKPLLKPAKLINIVTEKK
jgi:hypothetical protein